jgi:enoyl-CoA hydratase
MLTDRVVRADEAERIGFVAAVIPDGELLNAALDRARAMAKLSRFGVEMTKTLMWANLDAESLAAALRLEDRSQILTRFTQQGPSAMRSFLARKRAPDE